MSRLLPVIGLPINYVIIVYDEISGDNLDGIHHGEAAEDEQGQAKGSQLKVLKIFRLMRLAKLLRLARIKRVIKNLSVAYPGLWTGSKLSSILFAIGFAAHIFACAWYSFGIETQLTTVDGHSMQTDGWVKRQLTSSYVCATDDTHGAGYDCDGNQLQPSHLSWVHSYVDAYCE